jgi:molybdenum cofactor biosynthesis enzyme
MQLTVSAQGTVAFRPDKFELVSSEKLPKGPFLETSRLAAFLSAKRDSFFENKVYITHMEVKHHWGPSNLAFEVRLVAEGGYKEILQRAWFSAFIACLTCYDMVKAVDPDAVIENVGITAINDRELPMKTLALVNQVKEAGFSPTVVACGRIKSAFNSHPSKGTTLVRCVPLEPDAIKEEKHDEGK